MDQSPSPISNAISKRDKIVASCRHYSNQLKKWEEAVIKTEGRKPGKEDLKNAPETIQSAYKKYYKFRKYLETTTSRTPKSNKNGLKSKVYSPIKIFDSKGANRIGSKVTSALASTSRISEQRKLENDLKPSASSRGLSFNSYSRFSEKIRSAVNIFSRESTTKLHKVIKVVEDESGKEVSRTALIPSRFSKKQTNQTIDANLGNKTSNKSFNTSDSSGHSSLLVDDVEGVNGNGMDLMENNDLKSSKGPRKLNSISAIWQNLSPSPKSTSKKALGRTASMKHVDSGWLDRCGKDVEKSNKNSDSELDLSLNNIESKTELLQTSPGGLFASDFQPIMTAVTADTNIMESCVMQEDCYNYSIEHLDERQESLPTMDPDSIDSGIGNDPSTSFILSAEDIQDVIMNEVLPLTSSSITASDKINFHSDNACSPPESSFPTIDLNAVTEILTSDSSVLTSTAPSTSPITDMDEISRKRTRAFAFSPSPKKPELKKKFFKSGRSHVGRRLQYTVSSYKPLTPVKKKPVKPTPITAAKQAVLDVTNAPHNSSQPSDICGTTKGNDQKPVKHGNNLSSATSNSNKSLDTINSSFDEDDDDETSAPVVKTRSASSKKSKKGTKASSKAKPKKASVALKKRVEGEKSQVGSAALISKPSSSNFEQNNDYFDEATHHSAIRKGNKRIRLTSKQILDSKIINGKVNDNYVRIDITKKVFVRGKKRISGAKTKRNDWKLRKAESSREDKLKSMTCRKCGETGHFAKFCMKDLLAKDEPDEIDDSPFPTLEEAAGMLKSKHAYKQNANTVRTNVYTSAGGGEAHQSIASQNDDSDNGQSVQVLENSESKLPENDDHSGISSQNAVSLSVKIEPPYFGCGAGSILCSQDEEESILKEALKTFGYDEFRSGQMEAISRVLKGLSTLVILSTGSGKSLCYQLPAYLYAKKNPGALAICVSPLVSLMEDQVQGISPLIQAACLHSSMTSIQKEKVLDRIRSKKLHVLLVSPEAVCGGLFGLLRGVMDLPQISFACIDEVHCVSQWSHNFRPTYLQISKILREKLKVQTILGLTATATEYTANSICDHLQIDPSTTIRGEIIPNNLNLSVSRDIRRDEALLELLRGKRFRDCESIIIYCTRREECQRIACLIRTNLQDVPGFNGISRPNQRQRISNNCEAYHAGMTAGRRRLVQQQFMSGNIRIVVATVAFGMGIDKSNIRTVIHYNMPKTFESYVQEIGRAGRDGLPAHCHLFLDNVKGRDLSELKRHVYSNSVDRPTLRKLLRKVFQPCKCSRIAELAQKNGTQFSQTTKRDPNSRCPGHEISFNINETVTELDLPQENITTLLCYLELDKERKWVEILPHTYQTCKIHSYGGSKLLKSSAMKCPPLAAAIALKKEKGKFKESDTYFEFNVIEVASTLGWNSGTVKKELKSLEFTATNFDGQGNTTRFRKSGILVEFCDLAFHLNSPGDLTDEEADVILDYLHGHNLDQEKSQLYQLHRVYQALLSISCPNADDCSDEYDEEKSETLKKFIYNYFTQKTLGVPSDWKNETGINDGKDEDILRDTRDLVSSVRDVQFTGRAVAKIFQGIPSPCFPAEQWSRNRAFWRKHIEVDFNYLCRLAGQELLRIQ